MNAKKLEQIRKDHGIPAIISTEAEAAAMAAAVNRASMAADIVDAWKEAAKATIREAVNNGEAYEDDDASASGHVYKAGAMFGHWAIVETITETSRFSAADAKKLLTAEQVSACTKYGTRTSYTAEAV